jgi:prophage regulatory protein
MKRQTTAKSVRHPGLGRNRQGAMASCRMPGISVAACKGAAAPWPTTPGPECDAGSPTLTAHVGQARFDDDELWSLGVVLAKTGLSRSSIYAYIDRGIFPRQRHLGPRRVGWLASEMRAWIASRPS